MARKKTHPGHGLPWLLGAAFVAIALAYAGLEAFRGARAEAALFSPPRQPVHVPSALASIPLRDVAFGDRGGIHGWYVAGKNGAVVVLAHGSGSNRSQLSSEARLLADAGFGVLAFDWPGHGESAGAVTYGATERAALRSAVSFAAAQPDVDARRVGLLGFSVGAALAAITAPEEPRIRALALVSCFADSDEQTRDQFGPSHAIMKWAAVAVDHHYMPEAPLRPVDAVRHLGGTDLLVIAGSNDPIVPAWMSREVYDAATGQKEWLLVSHEGHGGFDAAADGPYREALLEFFRRALGTARRESAAGAHVQL